MPTVTASAAAVATVSMVPSTGCATAWYADRAARRSAWRRPSAVGAVGQHLGHAAQQLGQDRPGVAAGADQRAVRQGAYRLGEAGPVAGGRVAVEDRVDGWVADSTVR